MSKNSGGNGGGPSKNLSPEEHARRKQAAKARRRRGGQSGRLSMTPDDGLLAGIRADRQANWQDYLDDVRDQAVILLRRYGSNPPHGKQEPRWAPETIEMAVALLESYFSGEAIDTILNTQIVRDVRVAFARACLERKVHYLPMQDADWYAEALAKAEQLRAARLRKTPVNA